MNYAWISFITWVDLIWLDFWCFNATFSNISAISCRPVLVVEEAGVPGENHRPRASNWQTFSTCGCKSSAPFFCTWVEQSCMHGSIQLNKMHIYLSWLNSQVINKPAAFDYGFNHWYSCDEVLKWNKVEKQLNKMKQNVII